MCNLNFTKVLILTMILLLLTISINADVPQVINYQGRLTDSGGNPVTDGSYSVVFTIYDAASGGNSKWSETQSITTSDGLFAVLLGSINPILDTVFNGTTRYLSLEVAGDPELSPRIALVSVPYAHRVSTIDGAGGGDITSDVVIEGRLESEKIHINGVHPDYPVQMYPTPLFVWDKEPEPSGSIFLSTGDPGTMIPTYLHLISLIENFTGESRQVVFFRQRTLADDRSWYLGSSNRVQSDTSYGNFCLRAYAANDYALQVSYLTGYFGVGDFDTWEEPTNLLHVEGNGTDVGGVTDYPEVIARFVQNQAGQHSAISIDALSGQDAVLYLSDNSQVKWMLRHDASQEDKFKIRDSTGATHFTLTQAGDVGLGTTSPNYKLDVRGTIGNSGTVYHSDRRWKRNIVTLSNSLDKLQLLRGVSFDWKKNEFNDMNFPEGKQIGLIAQEVEEVIPEVVNTAVDGYKSVDYSKLIALLIEANKEQQKQIDELKAVVQQLADQNKEDKSSFGLK